jgi:lipid-A-disaccharide synthase-like uncharacterized protein
MGAKPAMHEALFYAFGAKVTPWKLIGYLGVFLFSARWLVQVWVSRRTQQVTIPRVFWYMSIAGSLLCLAYFVWGKNDSVGILAYLFPTLVSCYNLYLDVAGRRRAAREAAGGT